MKNLVKKTSILRLSIKASIFILVSLNFYAAKILNAESSPLAQIEREKKVTANNKEMVTTIIRAKFISIIRQSGVIEFLENAITEREDTSFLADKMIVYYDETKEKEINQKNEAGSIKKINAFGHVKIFNQEIVATGDAGSYDPSLGIFTIEENVIFNNGTSIANGKKFVYDANTKKSNLFGEEKKEGELKDSRVLIIIGEEEKDKKIKR